MCSFKKRKQGHLIASQTPIDFTPDNNSHKDRLRRGSKRATRKSHQFNDR
jgi:hypothetical protein